MTYAIETPNATPPTSGSTESGTSQRSKKPKWLAVMLFVCSVLYLFPEVAFNAKLVEIAGGIDVSDEQLHNTELFGRTVSGIGVALLVADLVLKGWLTATKWRALLSFVVIVFVVWPTVFFGQKALIDAWLIEPSTPKQRQEAFFSSVLRSSLAMNAINIEGIPYNADAHNDASEMTFLALIGGLVYSNDRFLSHIDDKKIPILDRYIQNRANANFDEHYEKYKSLRVEVQNAWKTYQGHVGEYNQSIDSRHHRANKAWEDVESTIVSGYRDYQKAEQAYLARAEARAQKIAQPIFDLFQDQNRCHDRSGNSRTRCYNRVDERYERLLSNNSIPFKPMDYWLDIQLRRTKGETSWGEALGTLGLSAVLAGLEQVAGQAGEAQEDRIYTNRVSHYTPRILVLWKDKFRNETGYPMGIESMSVFRHHATTAEKVRQKMRSQGIELKSDWQVAHITLFKNTVKAKVIKETDAHWKAQAKQRDYDIKPNLSWPQFQKISAVQEQIRQQMGERYYIEPMLATWNNKQFYQHVIVPNVKRERNYWLAYIEAARTQFADGGPYAEQGKTALRSIIVPPISMGLSLFLVILTVFKLPGKCVALYHYHKPTPVPTLKSRSFQLGLSVMVFIVIFVIPVHFLSSKYTQKESTIGYFLDQISDTLTPSGAYAVRWVIHTQPLIHPVGARIDQSMGISQGFSSNLEHTIAQLDNSFENYKLNWLGSSQSIGSTDTAPLSTEQPDLTSKSLPLTIQSNVQYQPGFRVRIMNIKPRYQEGMLLPSGQYDIEVSANGYRSTRLWVTHTLASTHHRIDLDK
ncbi:hypothetical protein L4D20_10525 [Vibrio kyushuensis]|uniref:hypothetical protein n=1 Tax=Vibrio kyushuensis TaxID=2910249 RepID=UPI003D10FB38